MMHEARPMNVPPDGRGVGAFDLPRQGPDSRDDQRRGRLLYYPFLVADALEPPAERGCYIYTHARCLSLRA
jgi:hypothetical protein